MGPEAPAPPPRGVLGCLGASSSAWQSCSLLPTSVLWEVLSSWEGGAGGGSGEGRRSSWRQAGGSRHPKPSWACCNTTQPLKLALHLISRWRPARIPCSCGSPHPPPAPPACRRPHASAPTAGTAGQGSGGGGGGGGDTPLRCRGRVGALRVGEARDGLDMRIGADSWRSGHIKVDGASGRARATAKRLQEGTSCLSCCLHHRPRLFAIARSPNPFHPTPPNPTPPTMGLAPTTHSRAPPPASCRTMR